MTNQSFMSTSESTPSPTFVLFARGVIARLAIWATLRIAVQENWGGPHGPAKRTWLASAIVDSFENQITNPPDDLYVEETLLQVMVDEFDTVVDDGSAESVAKDIVRLWEETQAGNVESMIRFEELAEKTSGKRVNAQEKVISDDEDEEWEDEETSEDMDEGEEVPRLLNGTESSLPRESFVDQDGFTLVLSKKKR